MRPITHKSQTEKQRIKQQCLHQSSFTAARWQQYPLPYGSCAADKEQATKNKACQCAANACAQPRPLRQRRRERDSRRKRQRCLYDIPRQRLYRIPLRLPVFHKCNIHLHISFTPLLPAKLLSPRTKTRPDFYLQFRDYCLIHNYLFGSETAPEWWPNFAPRPPQALILDLTDCEAICPQRTSHTQMPGKRSKQTKLQPSYKKCSPVSRAEI